MFEVRPDFDPKAPLSFNLDRIAESPMNATPARSIPTITVGGTKYVFDECVGSYSNAKVIMRESTYKHYKFYTDGAKIDRIQTLAQHEKAEFEAGKDEDGDMFWQVSFWMSDLS